MKKKFVATVTLMICILGGMAVRITVLHRQPSLLQRAVKTLAAPTGYELGASTTYQWIAPNVILAALESTKMDYPIEYNYIMRIRTDTGGVSLLRHYHPNLRGAFQPAFSPDGQWYLCSTEGDQSFAYYLCATDNSKQYKVYSRRENGFPCEPYAWLGDSKHWISMPGFIDDPVQLRTLGIPRGPSLKMPTMPESCVLLLSGGPVHTVLRKSVGGGEGSEVQTVGIQIWDPTLPTKCQQLHVALPVPADVLEIVVSPRGDRLAWILHVRMEATGYNRICRIVRLLPPIPRRDSYQIWTTVLDGSSPQLVGEKLVGEKLVGEKLVGEKEVKRKWYPQAGNGVGGWWYESDFDNLAWTVDASHLSFIYQDAIWTVPAT